MEACGWEYVGIVRWWLGMTASEQAAWAGAFSSLLAVLVAFLVPVSIFMAQHIAAKRARKTQVVVMKSRMRMPLRRAVEWSRSLNIMRLQRPIFDTDALTVWRQVVVTQELDPLLIELSESHILGHEAAAALSNFVQHGLEFNRMVERYARLHIDPEQHSYAEKRAPYHAVDDLGEKVAQLALEAQRAFDAA